MTKWSDFCISKITYIGSAVSSAFIWDDTGSSLSNGRSVSGAWITQKISLGFTFCSVTKNISGNWSLIEILNNPFNQLKRPMNLPTDSPRRKVFISYYHKDDQYYKDEFERLTGDLFINKSVKLGDISTDVTADYISRLINEGHMNDTTVLIVLIGPKTKCRKHVDWEISAALDYRVGDGYSGLVGLFLPTHMDYGSTTYTPSSIPERLHRNVETGYAVLHDYTTNRAALQSMVEDAYSRRKSKQDEIVNRFLLQMTKNTCD